jgi:hypothetical protein
MRLSLTTFGITSTAVAVTFLGTSALAGGSLGRLNAGMQACIDSASEQACRAFEAQVTALRQNPAYGPSPHLCKEEIGELSQVASLLPLRDAVPSELMASVADVQQACQPSGF